MRFSHHFCRPRALFFPPLLSGCCVLHFAFPQNVKSLIRPRELLHHSNVPLNGCAGVLSLSSLKKNGAGRDGGELSFLELLRGGCGLVKSCGAQEVVGKLDDSWPSPEFLRRPHLLRHLAEVADVSQHRALDDGVRQVLLVPPGVEVRVESVDALHGGGALLAVPKNQVDPQVEVGAHEVTLQGLGGEK